MSSYLLDTNIICALASPKHSNHVKAMAKMRSLTPERVFLPLIAIAEIRFGLASVDNADQSQRAELENFLSTYPSPYGFDEGTVEPYSLLRAQLFRTWATRDKRGRSFVEKQAWELADQVTGKELGIDEADLLIASVAAEYNLTLATNDQNAKMRRIEEAAAKLQAEGKQFHLRIEYW
ncbi:MAG: type II toxin-antitoxin system VapC family toxin [Verrucomicrobiota bacterium]|jgi:predicted nucleic acid-binding protein